MKPENLSKNLLAVTKAKAKMYEYDVPEEHHINISNSPELTSLMDITIGIIGDDRYPKF